MRQVLWCSVLCWCLCGEVHTSWADETARVEAWSNPTKFAFEGIKSFRAKDLSQALVGDPKMIVASQRPQPLEAWLRLVESRVSEGYQSCGFPDVRVTAEFDTSRDQVVVRVEEGPRFVWGDVRISGNRAISSAELLVWLSEKHARGKRGAAVIPPKSDGPSAANRISNGQDHSGTVKRGRPASFSESARSWLNADIQRGCEDQGHFAARFRIEILRDPKTNVADLRIVFEDEGLQAIIQDVEFVGLKRHTPDEVLEELQLRRGASIKGRYVADLERQLADSGRFVKQKVLLLHTADRPSEVRLKFEVEEYEQIPKLAEPLSRRDDAVRRFANWVDQFPNQPQDLLCRWTYRVDPPPANAPPMPFQLQFPNAKSLSGVFALSPRRGFLMSMNITQADDRQTPLFTGLLANDRLAMFLPTRRSRFDMAIGDGLDRLLPAGRFLLPIKFTGVNRPGQQGQQRCSLGFGFNSRRRPDQAPLEMTVELPVAVALNALDRPEWKAVWQDGALVLTQDGVRLRIDEDTGRLLDAQFGKEVDRLLRVQVGEGLFDQEFARYDRASREVPNAFDASAPWNSFCRYFVSAGVDAAKSLQAVAPGVAGISAPDDDTADRALAFVDHPKLMELVAQSVSALFDGWMSDFLITENGQPSFWISGEFSLQAKHPFEAWGPVAMIAVDDLVGRDSWAWKVGRQAVLIMLSENDAAGKELWTLLSSPKTGPLACWTNSCALAWVAPNWQKMAADVGRRRLDRSLFQHDVEGLLQQGGRMQRASERFAQQLRTFSDDELATAVQILLDENFTSSLNRQRRRWIRDEELPNEDLLPMLLSSLWKPLLEAKLSETLISRQNLGGNSLTPEMVQFLNQVEGRKTNTAPSVVEASKPNPAVKSPLKIDPSTSDLLQLRTAERTKGSLLFREDPPAAEKNAAGPSKTSNSPPTLMP